MDRTLEKLLDEATRLYSTDIDRAARRIDAAIDLVRQRHGGDNKPAAAQLNRLGLKLLHAGQLDAALRIFNRAYEIRQKQRQTAPLAFAQAAHNLALCHVEKGERCKAESLFVDAIQIRQQNSGDGDTVTALYMSNLARLYKNSTRTSEAQALYADALAIYQRAAKPDPRGQSNCLHNMGVMFLGMGEYHTAERYLLDALDLREKKTRIVTDIASTEHALGDVNREQRRYEAAQWRYDRALAYFKSRLPAGHPRFAPLLESLGGLAFEQGQYEAATSYLESVYDIVSRYKGDDHRDAARCLTNLAAVLRAVGQTDRVIDHVVRAAAIIDRSIDLDRGLFASRERARYLDSVRGSTDMLISLLVDGHRSVAQLFQGLDCVLRRKGLHAEIAVAQRQALARRSDDEVNPVDQQLTEVQSEIERLQLDGPQDLDHVEHAQKLRTLVETRDGLERSQARTLPGLNVVQSLQKLTSAKILKGHQLPENSAIVEFIRYRAYDFGAVLSRNQARYGPDRYAAFVVQARSPESLTLLDLTDADAVDKALNAFRLTLVSDMRRGDAYRDVPMDTGDNDYVQEDGSRLTRQLFEPLREHFDGCTRLFICPDSELTQLPFQALPLAAGERVIDVYTISYLNTMRDLARPAPADSAVTKPALVITAPAYNLSLATPAGNQTRPVGLNQQTALMREAAYPFGLLPKTRDEGEKIAALLHVDALTGADALERTVKSRRSPRVLHIATHGFFLRNREQAPTADDNNSGIDRLTRLALIEDPLLRGGLVLAGANTWSRGGHLPPAAEDGILNGRDVATLDLTGTRLVVLSACNTGAGDVRRGEGVAGLRSAFRLAGARTLVMSLWKVPDEETAQLMIDFYHQIAVQMPPACALREAQLAMKRVNPNPIFWGAFICEGEGGSIPELETAA